MSAYVVGETVNRPGFYHNGVAQDTRSTVTSAPITAIQSATLVTTSAPFFSSADVGKVLKWINGQKAIITGFTSSQQVTVTPNQAVPSGTFLMQGHTLGGNFGQCKVVSDAGVIGLTEEILSNADDNFVWYNTVTGEYRDLGSTQNGFIVDIDEAGFLLCDINPGFTGHQALIYNPNTNTFTSQGVPNGGPQNTDHQAEPVQMNASHVVAVSGSLFSKSRAYRGFGGALTDIHPADADVGGPGDSFCVGINTAGHIAGFYIAPADGFPRGFYNAGGASVTMTGFAGEVDPIAINDSNVIIGSCDDGLGNFVAFSWTPLGGPVFLPKILGTVNGGANAVNNLGWIVGDMDGTAFLYRNGITQDVFSLVHAIDPLWTEIFSASLINDKKQIVGFGTFSGVQKGYLLTLV